MITLQPLEKVLTLRDEQQVCHPEHDPFAMIQDDIYRRLPIAILTLPECKHEKPCERCAAEHRRLLVRKYTESMKHVHRSYREFAVFAVTLAETTVWPGQGEPALFKEKRREEAARAVLGDLEIADALCVEVIELPAEEILSIFREAAQETVGRLLATFRNGLELLQEQQIIGQITWKGKRSCVYGFHRVRRSEHFVGERTSERTGKREDAVKNEWIEYRTVAVTQTFEKSDLREDHEHHLFNATRHQFPAPKVRKPRFVLDLLTKIPVDLRPHVWIVEGDMLKEGIETFESPVGSRDVTEEKEEIIRSGRLYSPAVTLADFVLTGWSGADL